MCRDDEMEKNQMKTETRFFCRIVEDEDWYDSAEREGINN